MGHHTRVCERPSAGYPSGAVHATNRGCEGCSSLWAYGSSMHSTECRMQRLKRDAHISSHLQVRFHILSCHELCLPSATLPSNSPSPSSTIDPHLNRQQLANTLASLLEIFSSMPDDSAREEGEFWGYSILLNLGSPALSLSLTKMRPSTLHSPQVERARQALR